MALLSLAAIDVPSLVEHLRLVADPLVFNDDTRIQIWPFLRDYDPALFRDDYIADYTSRTLVPFGFASLYRALALLFDPRAVATVLPYLTLLATVAAIAASAARLAGPAAGLAAALLCLSADIFLNRMMGGLPRAFGYPLVALVMLGLIHGRPLWIAAATIGGGALYYVAGLLGGLSLAALLFVVPSSWRGQAAAWPMPRRAALLALTGLATLALALPGALGAAEYGPMVTMAQADAYPEAGVGGRWGPESLPIAMNIAVESTRWAVLGLIGGKPVHALAPVLLFSAIAAAVAAVIFGVVAGVRETPLRRLLILPALAGGAYYAAAAAAPYLYLPQRYLVYVVPPLMVLLLPVGLAALAHRARLGDPGSALRAAVIFLPCLALALTLGGRDIRNGLIEVPRDDAPLYRFIADLPPASLIAGWPQGLIDNVPILTGRPVLVNFEGHQAFHSQYILEMRRRTNALIDALYAAGPEPLVRLREAYGVTHLVVDTDLYRAAPPAYFKPFDARITAAARALTGPSAAVSAIEAAGVFRHGNIAVLDLSRVEAAAP